MITWIMPYRTDFGPMVQGREGSSWLYHDWPRTWYALPNYQYGQPQVTGTVRPVREP